MFKLVVLVSVLIAVIHARPSGVALLQPGTITSVDNGAGISTTVVDGTPVVAVAPAGVTLIAGAPIAPISTTVIQAAVPADNGESENSSDSGDNGESDESGDDSGEDSGSGEEASDEGVEATEASVDESLSNEVADAAVVAAPGPISTTVVEAAPGPISTTVVEAAPVASAIVAVPATAVIGSVPTSISSHSSTVVHSSQLVAVPGPAVPLSIAPAAVALAPVHAPAAVVIPAGLPAAVNLHTIPHEQSVAIQAPVHSVPVVAAIPQYVNIL